MNGTIAKYFKSPKASTGGEEELRKDEEGKAVPVVEEPEPGPSKPSKSDVDRLIAENMASVLKSLKKKRSHRCSKRKRNEEHREKGEAPAEDDGSGSSHNTSPQKAKENPVPADPPPDLPAQDPPKEGSNKENKTVNAFQLMMASRNKAIGSNSPGRDTNSDTPDPVEAQKKDEKVKRKLKLEEWADRKGAGKRKLQEDAQEEYIEHQMKRRAKRLKKLIKNMEVEEEDEEVDPPPEPVLRESPRKSARKTKEPPPEVVPLKVIAKRGRRRLSSEDSRVPSEAAATPEQSPAKKSAEDEEFVTKLSSPLKKKDSLLGYFAKVGKSPSETAAPEVTTTPTKTPTVAENLPRRGRPRRQPAPPAPALPPEAVQDLVLNPIIVEELSEDVPETPPSSGRPRRSCAGKVKDYAVFGGTSPDKEATSAATPTAASNFGKRGKKPIVVGSPAVVKSPSVVSRRLSGDEDGTPRSSQGNVKLAPLFVKKVAEDPEKVRARQQFLMSGIPERMRLEIERQRCYEESILNESPVFPLVSHVQQLGEEEEERSLGVVELGDCRVRIVPEGLKEEDGGEEEDEDEFEFATLTSCDDDQVEGVLAKLVDQGDHRFRSELPEIADVKSIVREWKQVNKHFPVFKCYKQFRATFVEHCDEPLPPGRTREEVVSEDSIELIEPKFSHANGELLFTEKYKPLKLDDILINCQPAITLKKFLSSWKEDRSQGNPYDSGDDFELSNSSSASSSAVCNHIVLVGPPGCGKTSNVYAVANDMNFNVLELNASSRRKGKIILQELQEATQSHQVRRKEAESGVDIFKKAIASSRKASKTKLRKASTDSETSAKKLSLILIEDADIVFDQDDGFVAAINQLISTSKRPIVLTTTDPNCQHLSRFISNNVIRYVAPGIAHVAKLLSILAIVEKVHIDQADLARLYALNRKDLRKTLNELQFFIQSGGDRGLPPIPLLVHEPELRLRESSTTPTFTDHDETSNQSEPATKQQNSAPTHRHRSLFRLFSRNQNEPRQLIRAPLNLDNLWCNMERVLRTSPPEVASKRKKGKTAAAVVVPLDELVFFYENASVASLIQRDAKAVGDRLVDRLEEDIAHELVEKSWERWFEGELGGQAAAVAKGKRRSGVGAMCYDSLKQFDDEGRQTISAYIGLGGPIRTRATYCDCEPLLRAICRTERERSRVERRGSRFYHYFRNYVGGGNGTLPLLAPVPATSFSVDHFDALSTRFEEDPKTVAREVAAAAESSDESR
uniref:Putative replication factor c large subunit n=1 Tax=Culex tarsalis TaxID=7177 RepID=A0A1Q3EVP0_CULTA